MMLSYVAPTISSMSARSIWEKVGLITHSPSTRATRTSEMESVERNVAYCERCRGGNACQCIGSIVFISRVESDVYESLRMIVVGEERTENAVNRAGGQNLVVAGASFAFKEASVVTADGGVFLFVFHREGHEVNALAGFFCRTYGKRGA